MRFILIHTIFLFLFSCKSTQQQDKAVVADTIKAADEIPVWAGVYSGSLPCSDCAGIFTRLELKESNQYKMERIYLGKSPEVNTTEGKINWQKENQVLSLESSSQPAMYFSINENILTKLDDKQQPVTGPDSVRFTLIKQDPIAERSWRAFWIEQSTASPQEHINDISLSLSAAEKRASGKGGCNSYSAGYLMSHPNGLRFSGIVSTKMACPALQAETDFFKALESCRSFEVKNDTLTLFKENKMAVAKF